jgi:hypothetical protein
VTRQQAHFVSCTQTILFIILCFLLLLMGGFYLCEGWTPFLTRLDIITLIISLLGIAANHTNTKVTSPKTPENPDGDSHDQDG